MVPWESFPHLLHKLLFGGGPGGGFTQQSHFGSFAQDGSGAHLSGSTLGSQLFALRRERGLPSRGLVS